MRKSNGLLVVFVVAFIFCAVNGWALEENCLGCHEKLSPMVVEQWRDSAHGKPDPVPYLPGAVFEKGPNLRPGIDVPDLRELEKKQ